MAIVRKLGPLGSISCFKIIPILNPDGVINGNYRCSLSSQDLNRRWKTPNKILHPVNFYVKKLIRQGSSLKRGNLCYIAICMGIRDEKTSSCMVTISESTLMLAAFSHTFCRRYATISHSTKAGSP